MDKIKSLMPQIKDLKQINANDEVICWEAYDASGKLLGYAFAKDVPDYVAGIPGMEDMDKYQVFGIVDARDYKVLSLDIALHPDGPPEPWSKEITEPDFEKQFLGLTVSEIGLAPDGRIDAISEATLSSQWLTDAIRDKVAEIVKQTKK